MPCCLHVACPAGSSIHGNVALVQVDELDQSNNELEDTNTRLEARAEHAQGQVSQLKQELEEALAQVLSASSLL